MKNFIFKSDADFHKILFNKLDIISGNMLYMTHEIDKCNKNILSIENQLKLQKQVDDYFDKDETSPQTDSDEQ